MCIILQLILKIPLYCTYSSVKGQVLVFTSTESNSQSCSSCVTADAHGATDVTGFGILGHATNLVKTQTSSVSFKIHTLPSELSVITIAMYAICAYMYMYLHSANTVYICMYILTVFTCTFGSGTDTCMGAYKG